MHYTYLLPLRSDSMELLLSIVTSYDVIAVVVVVVERKKELK